MRMFEVRVVRRRQGGERKHKVWSYAVVARSEQEARALMIDAAPYDTIVRVAAMTTAMPFGKVDSLTDGELTVTRTEGYEAMLAERHQKVISRIKAEIVLAEARDTDLARRLAAKYAVADAALAF